MYKLFGSQYDSKQTVRRPNRKTRKKHVSRWTLRKYQVLNMVLLIQGCICQVSPPGQEFKLPMLKAMFLGKENHLRNCDYSWGCIRPGRNHTLSLSSCIYMDTGAFAPIQGYIVRKKKYIFYKKVYTWSTRKYLLHHNNI